METFEVVYEQTVGDGERGEARTVAFDGPEAAERARREYDLECRSWVVLFPGGAVTLRKVEILDYCRAES